MTGCDPLSPFSQESSTATMQRKTAIPPTVRSTDDLNIDIETSSECGGAVKVVTCIEDPVVIEKILTDLNEKSLSIEAPRCPKAEHCRKRAYMTEAKRSNDSTEVAAAQAQAAEHLLA